MMAFYPALIFLLRTAIGETQTGNCKDMLQGYLTGQLSSALGAYQVEALRREFKSFTDVIEESMKKFKKEVNASMQDDGKGNKNIVYTRWGKKNCPSNAKLVYSGDNSMQGEISINLKHHVEQIPSKHQYVGSTLGQSS